MSSNVSTVAREKESRSPRSTKARRHRSQKRVRRDQLPEDLIDTEDFKKGKDASTRMFYTKVITGLVMGVTIGILFALTNGDLSLAANPDPTGIHTLWWFFPIAGLTIAMLITRYIWKFSRLEIDRKRLFLSGTFSLVAIFIFSCGLTWMLLTELLNPGYVLQLVALG